MLKTVRKVGPVLALFTPEHPEWRLTELADALDMPKSSAHALLTTLKNIDLLAVTPQGRYRLSSSLIRHSRRMGHREPLRRAAQPVMEDLAKELRETISLCVVDGDQANTLAYIEGNHPVVRAGGFTVGSVVPLRTTAVGWVLLAERPEREVLQILTCGPTVDESPSADEVRELCATKLQSVRANGHAIEFGNYKPDIACIATPVRSEFQTTVAALNVMMPTYRFRKRRAEIMARLHEAAARIGALQHDLGAVALLESEAVALAG